MVAGEKQPGERLGRPEAPLMMYHEDVTQAHTGSQRRGAGTSVGLRPQLCGRNSRGWWRSRSQLVCHRLCSPLFHSFTRTRAAGPCDPVPPSVPLGFHTLAYQPLHCRPTAWSTEVTHAFCREDACMDGEGMRRWQPGQVKRGRVVEETQRTVSWEHVCEFGQLTKSRKGKTRSSSIRCCFTLLRRGGWNG